MKPSTAAVLALLRAKGPIGVTSLTALEHTRTLRLAARIDDLRREGFDIETVMERGPNRKSWARYVLHERPVVYRGVQLPLDSQPSGEPRHAASPRAPDPVFSARPAAERPAAVASRSG